jgi:hypothetical protein
LAKALEAGWADGDYSALLEGILPKDC